MQTDALVLASGSTTVTAGETFAWKDGTTNTSNNGSIEFSVGGGQFVAGGQQFVPLALATPLETNSQGPREYAVNMTATPECRRMQRP